MNEIIIETKAYINIARSGCQNSSSNAVDISAAIEPIVIPII
jgi:hypothetical protein